MATGLFNLKQVNQAISQGAWSGYIAPRWVEYLVVSGGGAGGADDGGGGGAGGLLAGIVTVAAGASYSVTVGAGGTAGSFPSAGGDGVASVFGSISSTGGGGGGFRSDTLFSGRTGGSGGGSSNIASGERINSGGIAVAGQGNYGGQNTLSSAYGSGGGGGAGTVGINATSTTGGSGGAGIASAITGTVVAYSGGGGGSTRSGTAGSGGVGGGGTSGVGTSNNGTAGAANTGGGGGGGAFNSSLGGAGGSGIVVVRYPGNVQFYTGGTVNYNNGYIIHIFTSNGTLAPTAPAPYNTSYQISRSLRFNSADSTYLNRTPASASNRTTWTWSGWIKFAATETQQIFVAGSDSSNRTYFVLDSAKLKFFTDLGGSSITTLTTTQVFRDSSAWYHMVYAVDTTQATASNRIKLYVNGVQVTTFDAATYQNQNTDTFVNAANAHYIGNRGFTNEQLLNGYMTEINFVDGTQLTPSSFGATSTTTGVWAPIQYSGTYGTNGFYLNFSDNSNTTAATLGKDYSGNGNNWTPNNFSVTAGAGNDSLVDSPTQYGFDTGVGGSVRGNYCTFNPLDKNSSLVVTNGNLDVTENTSNWINGRCTIGVSSGKWYVESTLTAGLFQVFGIANSLTINTGYSEGSVVGNWAYSTDGAKILNGAYTPGYGATYTTNDVIGMAFDADAGTLTMYKNGVSQGVLVSGLPANTYFPWVALNAYASSGGVATVSLNFGQRAFAYTPPSGFKALNTQNLPTPAIGATSNSLATQFFNIKLYTGNGSAGNAQSGLGFQPDFLWFKSRSAARSHGLFNAVMTRTFGLASESNTSEYTSIAGRDLASFDSDGFTVGVPENFGSTNTSGDSIVAWAWKANGTGASNSAGSITSTVSANTTSGFSVVTYTGTGANATVGHGLGVAPSMIISKSRTSTGSDGNWPVYHKSLGATDYLILNTTAATAANIGAYNNTSPTSSVFSVGTFTGTNGSALGIIAYCFAPIAGYSAFGSYTGNGSADGPFVFTGMRPAYVMIKRSSAVADWYVLDVVRNTYNAANLNLYPNLSNAEATFSALDILSNGFKIRNSDNDFNASGGTYIYMAFASNPFKTSLAR